MDTLPLQGVIPALITPFTPDGTKVDDRTLTALVERCITAGVDGLLTCGGTGEFPALTVSERQHVVEVVVSASAGRVPVVAQTGGLSTAEAIAMSKHAKDAGASALMIGVPFYEPMTFGQTRRYLADVAAEVDIDLMYYNYPYATGFFLDARQLVTLTETVPAIRYLKDSSGNFAAMTSFVRECPQVRLFAGSDALSGPALLAGASGLINGCANVFPGAFVEMTAAAQSGDQAAVTRVWTQLMPLLAFVETNPFVSAIKAACSLIADDGGPVRAPLTELDERQTAALRDILGPVAALFPQPSFA